MLTTALLLLCASAAAQPAFLADGAPRSIRLIADQPEPPPPDLPSYAGWSKQQLQQEYERLKEARPGIGLPIALMSSGGGVLVLSLYVLLLGLLPSSGFTSSSLPFFVVFGVIGTGGAAMLTIGGIVLSRVLPERRPYGRQLDEVDRLIKESDEDRQPDPPPYLPPPLPPFTPQASVQFPLIFARF